MESLVALAVLVAIVGLILNQVDYNRRIMADSLHRQEIMSVATMAVQSGQNQLSLNGISVTVKRTSSSLSVYESEQEVMHVDKN